MLQLTLDNDEQRVGADIIKRALPYSLKLIARNAGVNGSVVVQKVRVQLLIPPPLFPETAWHRPWPDNEPLSSG